jgi:hypothetical protein
VTQQPRGSGPDPIGDFQRWLLRSGARGVSRELGGRIAGVLRPGGKQEDVWASATAPPADEAPECAWCPVCRAARLLRENGPGLASHVATASDVVASAVQEAMTVLDAALSAAGRRPEDGGGADGGDAAGAPSWDEATAAAWEAELAGADLTGGPAGPRDQAAGETVAGDQVAGDQVAGDQVAGETAAGPGGVWAEAVEETGPTVAGAGAPADGQAEAAGPGEPPGSAPSPQ